MATSTITVAGINPALNILGATQQFNYNQSLSTFQLNNIFIPTSLISSQTNSEFRNNLLSGFRWVHLTSNTDTYGSLTLQSFVNASPTGTNLISFSSSGINLDSQIVTNGTWQGTPIGLAYGGTNADLAASNGGIFYSTASAGAILAGTATANQVLLSGASTTPNWSTAVYPATTTINQLLYSSSANTIVGLATANSGVLITSSGGVPSISTTIPLTTQLNITQLGTITTGTWNGSIVGLTYGGTNASLTASNGGIFYSTASTGAILSGTATANQVLLSGSSAAPNWSTAVYPSTTTINQILYSSASNTITGLTTANNGVLITSSGGIPSISSTLPTAVQGNITSVGTIGSGTWNGSTIGVGYGGTGITSTTAYSVLCGGTTSTGALQSVASLGTSGQILTSQGASSLPIWTNVGTGTVTLITAGTGLSGGTMTTSGTISITNTAVTAGSYTYASFTVNAQGQLTAASSGTTPVTSVSGGTGITITGSTTPSVAITNTTVTAGSYIAANITVNAQGQLTAASNSGAVIGPNSAVSNNIATFNGTTGQLVQDSGIASNSVVTVINTGTAATCGIGTLSSGTATINTTAIKTTSIVNITRNSGTGTPSFTNAGELNVGSIISNTSFIISSSNILDSSGFSWQIVNPA